MKKNFKFIIVCTIIVLFMRFLYNIILGFTAIQAFMIDIDIYIIVIFIFSLATYFNSTIINNKEKDIKEIEDYYNNIRMYVLGEKINNNDEKNVNEYNTSDILGLMSLNMKEIKEYYVLSKTMTKYSFILSIIMCILGFSIISSSLFALLFIDKSFMETLIPVIGGSVVEVIAGTTLVVYKKSLEQLNQYYESLHNNERFLSLVNLVDKISDDKKDETYINIINNQLEILKKSQ